MPIVSTTKMTAEQYHAFGVQHYWIIDPERRSVEAYQLEHGKYRRSGEGRGSDVVCLPPFADLEIPLAELWQPTL